MRLHRMGRRERRPRGARQPGVRARVPHPVRPDDLPISRLVHKNTGDPVAPHYPTGLRQVTTVKRTRGHCGLRTSCARRSAARPAGHYLPRRFARSMPVVAPLRSCGCTARCSARASAGAMARPDAPHSRDGSAVPRPARAPRDPPLAPLRSLSPRASRAAEFRLTLERLPALTRRPGGATRPAGGAARHRRPSTRAPSWSRASAATAKRRRRIKTQLAVDYCARAHRHPGQPGDGKPVRPGASDLPGGQASPANEGEGDMPG